MNKNHTNYSNKVTIFLLEKRTCLRNEKRLQMEGTGKNDMEHNMKLKSEAIIKKYQITHLQFIG